MERVIRFQTSAAIRSSRGKRDKVTPEQRVNDFTPDPVKKPDLDSFTRAYITAALWSSSAEIGGFTDASFEDMGFDVSDLAPETLAKMTKECAKFQSDNLDAIESGCLTRLSCYEQAGHDFWLTRNGHGCGFWETSDWSEPQGAELTNAAKSLGTSDLYLGDDGKVYAQ